MLILTQRDSPCTERRASQNVDIYAVLFLLQSFNFHPVEIFGNIWQHLQRSSVLLLHIYYITTYFHTKICYKIAPSIRNLTTKNCCWLFCGLKNPPKKPIHVFKRTDKTENTYIQIHESSCETTRCKKSLFFLHLMLKEHIGSKQ